MTVLDPRNLLSASAALCATAFMLVPSTSLAHDPMYPKIGFHFRLGLGGDMQGEAGSAPTQRDAMEPSVGGGVELEIPITNHFSLGGAIETYAWTVARAGGTYNASFDFLFMPRFRIPFGDHPWHAEVYFGIPIGPTVSVPSDHFANAVATGALDVGVGITGGGRVGVRLDAHDFLGLFADVGPMIQWVSLPVRGGGPNFELWNYQFVLRIGASFGFGSRINPD